MGGSRRGFRSHLNPAYEKLRPPSMVDPWDSPVADIKFLSSCTVHVETCYKAPSPEIATERPVTGRYCCALARRR